MDKNLIVEKYFTKKSTVKMIASYILYYQVSLSNYLFEVTQDMELTIKKIKELNLTLEPNKVILIVFDLIKTYVEEEDFDQKLERYIKMSAMMQALKDLALNTKELDWKDFIDTKTTQILEETAFNRDMQRQYLMEYSQMHQHYDKLFTEEDVLGIQKILLEMD